MILYFTASGNSKFVAQALAALTGDEIMDMKPAIQAGEQLSVTSEKPFVVVAPVYAYAMPRLVAEAVRNANLQGSKELYFILTCGGSTANAYKGCKEIAARKGMVYKGFAEVKMPDNTVTMFNMSDEATAKATIAAAVPVVKQLGALIAAGADLGDRHSGFGPFTLLNSAVMKRMEAEKGWMVKADCIGCGLCVSQCPTNRIAMEDGRAQVNAGGCMSCFACIHNCPVGAIQVAGKSEKHGRYLCPAFEESWLA